MDDSGGDLAAFGKNIIKELNPVTQYHNIKNRVNNVQNATSNVDQQTKSYANLVSQTYKNENNRKDATDGYMLDKSHSGDHYSTYNKDGQHYLVFRGTKNAKDIPDDVKIATGTEDFSNDEKLFMKLKESIGDDGSWTLIGHSLGGTKAMLIGQKYGLKTQAFNPGYSRLFENQIELSRPDLRLHLVTTDPISNGLLVNKLHNATVYRSKSYNPFSSHSINYFTN